MVIALILFVSLGTPGTNAISSSKSRLMLYKNDDMRDIEISRPVP